jgi:hypothetical protein
MTPLGEAALKLGARGLRVFPCWPRKKEPAIKDNLRLAAIDETIIRRFWGAQGVYNIGVATGRASGVWVLDVDAAEGGEATLRELETKHGALPQTVESITGNNRHLWWRWPDGVDLRNWQIRDDLPGLDGRGEGGYVMAPPSIHPSGRAYAWSVDSASTFELAPDWLIRVAVERSTKSVRSNGGSAPALPQDWQAILASQHEGSRRAGALAKLCGRLLRNYVDPAVVVTFAHWFNERLCDPPLDPDEVLRIYRDIAKLEAERRGV